MGLGIRLRIRLPALLHDDFDSVQYALIFYGLQIDAALELRPRSQSQSESPFVRALVRLRLAR